MNSNELREMFLEFFESKKHLRIPSSSLIPSGDPTLLLTTAGMVQIKPYFLGEATPPSNRLTSSQKCFRTTDISTIGDHKHLTFFEMLGNFSVGDYFKESAIEFAWEFLTAKLGLESTRLWVTVYLEDDEAFSLWKDKIKIPVERIYRYGKKDNWWGPPGLEGPCGPCSEIHYDFGQTLGCAPIASPEQIKLWEVNRADSPTEFDQPGCHPNCDNCERFIELWNLVFMGFFQNQEKELSTLPSPNIDTGMGLERVSVISQRVKNVYETDLFRPIIQTVCSLTGNKYGVDTAIDKGIRVVAEHSRGAAFLIADGVIPGNDDRGYVLKRLLRRAAFYARNKLNYPSSNSPLLPQVVNTVINQFGGTYPELTINRNHILEVITNEEDRFYSTLDWGIHTMEILGSEAQDLLESVKSLVSKKPSDLLKLLDRFNSSGRIPESVATAYLTPLQEELTLSTLTKNNPQISIINLETKILSISGKAAFLLYDTFGFPPELTQEIGAGFGLKTNLEEFSEEMSLQQSRSRLGASKYTGPSSAKIFQYESLNFNNSKFIGYDQISGESSIIGIFLDGAVCENIQTGQHAEIVLQETPFYPEGGGQIGDRGLIIGPRGSMEVIDTQSPLSGLIIHKGIISSGTLSKGETVQSKVNASERQKIASNHTGTHLLHAALRSVLGHHVHQAGSLVTSDKIRFDFTHTKPLTDEELQQVEQLVNEQVRNDTPVEMKETRYSDAINEGALSFFGDKYGAEVRVVGIGSNREEQGESSEYFSKEMCGGTHLYRTGELGLFLILTENSIGAGMRRIEAISGSTSESTARNNFTTLSKLSKTLDSPNEGINEKIKSVLNELDSERKKNESLERRLALRDAETLVNQAIEIDGSLVLSAAVNVNSGESLREVGDYLKNKLQNGIIILGSVIKGRPMLVVMVTSDQVSKGFDAKEIIKTGSEIIGGGGGGKPEMAQAGGQYEEKLNEALKMMSRMVTN